MTRSGTLVLPDWLGEELTRASHERLETAGVLLVSVVGENEEQVKVLAREIWWVPDRGYRIRERDRLSILSNGYVDALCRAESIGASALWVHTHPGGSSVPSRYDRVVDGELAEAFRIRTGTEHYGALTVTSYGGTFAFTSHIELGKEAFPIDRMLVTGRRLKLIRSEGFEAQAAPEVFDRNVRAFGGDVQRVLNDLRVGIVGCGGTGSAVAEQLVRLGVRNLTLFDSDTLSESNLSRVYGSTPADVGKPKVEVLGAHLSGIAKDARVTTFSSMITVESTARALAACDVVFGCTDDNAGRLVLSRLSSYLLIPIFDCGVLISSDQGGRVSGIDGRVTVLAPGYPCLVCRGRIDLKRAAAELLTPGERRRLEDEGYAPGLGGVEPAVVPFTSLVASLAVAELLERLIGYGPDPAPSETLVRMHEREMSGNADVPNVGHYCDPAEGRLGVGETEPFLEQTWSA